MSEWSNALPTPKMRVRLTKEVIHFFEFDDKNPGKMPDGNVKPFRFDYSVRRHFSPKCYKHVNTECNGRSTCVTDATEMRAHT